MSPADRRQVHLALANETGVYTESEGKGFFKRVRIIPEDEDDLYEDEGDYTDDSTVIHRSAELRTHIRKDPQGRSR